MNLKMLWRRLLGAVAWATKERKTTLAAFCLAAALAGLAGPVQAGLIGHWTFDDGSANDTSGNGNHGALDGTATIVADPTRGAVLSVDGGGRVDLGDPASLQVVGEITVAAWVKAAEYASSQNSILNKGHDDNSASNVHPRREFTLRSEGSGAEYDVGTWQSGRTPDSNNHASGGNPGGDVGRWVHLAGVAAFDSGSNTYTWRLYRNGTEVGAFGPADDGMFEVNYGWAIGARGGPVSIQRGFNGLIDDVRIYDMALAGSEIAALAPEPAGLALAGVAGLAAFLRGRRSSRR